MVYVQEYTKDRYSKSEYRNLIIEVREDFQLYGEKDEIELFEQFMKFEIGEDQDADKARKAFNTLVELVRLRIEKS